MQARGQVLITAAELAGMIQAGDPVSILDVRWRLDEPDGHAAYLQGVTCRERYLCHSRTN